MSQLSVQTPEYESATTDQRIAAAVRALAAGRGIRNSDLAEVLGTSRTTIFAKIKGEAPWKAAEVESAAEYFGVSVGALFDGLGLFGNDEAPPVI